jgi:hypothetical protein
MKLAAFGIVMISAIIAPQISTKEVSSPPVAQVAYTVPTTMGQWENFTARMDQATRELNGILDDLENMNPENLMRLEPVLAELVVRQNELSEVLALGAVGLQDGLIESADELRSLNETVDPEISHFEEAVFRLRSALDQHLNLQAEI